MEANKTTEGPQDTQDAKEQPSLEDTNAEDLYEATTHETPLQPSSSQKHFQPPEIHLETPASLNPDTKGAEGLQDSSVSGTPPVKSSSSGLLSLPPQLSPQSVTSLEKAIAEIPLEEFGYDSPISKVKEEPLQLSPTANIPEYGSPISEVQKEPLEVSSTANIPKYESPVSEVQKEPLEVSPTASIPESSHELTSDKVPQTQVPESEHFPKHSFSESPTQAKEDESTKEGEAGEDELAVGTSKIPAAKPGLRAKKKKEKRAGGNCPYLSPVPVAFALPLIYPEVGDWVTLLHVSPLSLKAFSLPSGYSAPPFPGVTSRPVVPAKRAELVEMAKAVHREQFDDQVNNLFQWEKDSTLKAIQTGEPRWPSRGL